MPFKNTQERLDQIDSYLKKEINAGTYTNKKAKKDLKAAYNLINKRITALGLRKKVNKIIAGMGYTSKPGELLDSPQITKIKKWLTKNEVDLQGKKVIDNYALADELKKIYKLQDRDAGVKKASYLKKYASKIFDNVEIVKGKVFKYLKGFEDKLKTDPTFKKVVEEALPILKKKSLFDLTNDQRDTLLDSANTLKDREKKLPKNAITKAEFIKKTGFPETSIASWMGATKNEPVGKEFNKLYKPIVFANQATYFPDPDKKTIDKFKEFREQGTIQKSSAEQLDKLTSEKNLKKLDGYLSSKGKRMLPPLNVVQGILGKGTSAYNAAWIMSLYARALEGEKFRGLKNNIKKDVSKGKFIFKKIGEEGGRHNEYTVALYDYAVKQVDKDMGNRQAGRMTFQNFKNEYTDKMNELFKKHKIDRKFNINEVISIKGAFNNSMAPYAAFVDLTEQQINKGVLAAYQGDMSKAMAYLDKYRDDPEKFKRKIELFNRGLWEKDKLGKDVWRPGTKEKRIAELTKKFGPEAAEQVRFAEIIPGTKLTDTYKQTDLDFWKSQGLDLEKFAQEKGYYLDVKGARPYFEITQNRLLKAVENLSKKEQLAYCSLLSAGGLPGDCKNAIEKNPVKAAQVLADAPTSSSAMGSVKAIATNLLKRLPKGGRLGAILAGAGAVGAGTYAMMGDAEADETGTTDQSTMKFNETTGEFVNTETGDPETQTGILDWIADNPGKSGFAALPVMFGAGAGLAKAGLPGGQYLMGWKSIIPAMMIPEKMYQYKQGMEVPEMATDPLNALWALGLGRTKENMKYYQALAKQLGVPVNQVELGLRNLKPSQWKNLPRDMKNAIMAPASKGTNLAMGTTLRKPFLKAVDALKGQAGKQGLGALAKRAGLYGAAAIAAPFAAIPAGILTAGLLGADLLYGQYKDYRDGKAIIDSMRARGKISEEDAENYLSLVKQGSLPFGLGNRIFGDEEMTLRGQVLNADQQRQVLAGMEDQIDLFQDERQEVRALDRADDFDFFNEGGRVGFSEGNGVYDKDTQLGKRVAELMDDGYEFGEAVREAMKEGYKDGGRVGLAGGGGMDRRGFLKWLAGMAATLGAGATGLFKSGAKKGVEQVAKEVVKEAPQMLPGGVPAWFPRAVAKIKADGKLIEMADKDYVNGDIYEILLPVKEPKYDMVAGKAKQSGFETVNKRVLLEENPVSGEIEISWDVDDFDGSMKRQINFRPGESGFQKFGVDPEHPGAWEYQRVKINDPEFTYGNPDQSVPDRADFDFQDIVQDGDNVVGALENLTKTVDEKTLKEGDTAFQNKLYKDTEGEAGLLPDPEGHMTPEGWQGEGTQEIIEGEVPNWVPKDTTWHKKAKGGTVETGAIARRQSLVPPLAGPNPQGIMGLPSDVKQVRVG